MTTSPDEHAPTRGEPHAPGAAHAAADDVAGAPADVHDPLERIADAHVAFDARLRYVACNAAAERSMRRARATLFGRSLYEVFPDAAGSTSERCYRTVAETGVEQHFVEHYTGDGLDVHVEVDAYPVGTCAPFGVSVFWRDVTARVAAERALQAGEARLRLALQAADMATWEIDLDTGATRWDDRLAALLGHGPTGATAPSSGVRWLDHVHPDDRARVERAFAAAAAGTAAFDIEFRVLGADGTERWVASRAVRDTTAVEPRLVGLVQDITARKRADMERERLVATIERERARLEEVFRRAPSFAVVYRGPEHRYEFVNTAYYQLIGHRDVLGKPLDEVVPEAREQGFLALLDRVLATGEPLDFRETPVSLERTPGAPRALRYVDMVFQPLIEADGRTSGVLAQGVDITEHVLARREVERLLAETDAARAAEDLERRRLEAVLAAIPVGVIIAEAPSGQVRYANDAMAALWGHVPYSRTHDRYSEEWTGLHVVHGQPTDRLYASHEWPVARVLATGAPVLDEAIVAVRPDGTHRMVSASAAPVRGAGGEVVGVVATVADLEASFQAQRLLDEARQAAEAANRAKSEFLASMSHELRTPLNAIQGHVQLMQMELHGPVTTGQRDALGRVARAQQHLLGLINDVLNYAKLEAASVEYRLADVALAPIVDDVATMIAPEFVARGLDFRAEPPAPGATWGTAWADAEKLRQVLLNLLSNAAKFTPRGGAVTISVTPDPSDAARVRLQVRDTGIGIPDDKLEEVFAPFVQVHAGRDAYTRTHEGTGLGLAISRDLARGMGGELAAESVAGEGSVFTLTLRRTRTATGDATDRRSGHVPDEPRRSDRERRSGGDRRQPPPRRRASDEPAGRESA
jgi:PAS domain S-box-containing protein